MKKWICAILVGLCLISLPSVFPSAVRGQDLQPSTPVTEPSKKTTAKRTPLPKFKKNTVSVYLSPSTQEKNMGAGEFNTEEQRMNEIADVVEKILKKQGVTVYRNRPEMTLQELVAESNQHNVDLHFAIHSNAFNQKARGTECFCYRFGGAGERLAKKVMEQICSIYDGPRRGVKESADHFGKGKPLYETANTTAPTALVEIAFHDQPDDAQWILDNQKLIGEKLATALLLHLAEERPECVR